MQTNYLRHRKPFEIILFYIFFFALSLFSVWWCLVPCALCLVSFHVVRFWWICLNFISLCIDIKCIKSDYGKWSLPNWRKRSFRLFWVVFNKNCLFIDGKLVRKRKKWKHFKATWIVEMQKMQNLNEIFSSTLNFRNRLTTMPVIEWLIIIDLHEFQTLII